MKIAAVACSLVAGLGLAAFAKETENGKTMYEAELTVAGHRKDISMGGAGNIVEIEESVALKSLPDAARAAVEKAAGKGKVLKVESVSDGKQVVADEADIRVKGKTTEVRVDPQGNPAPKR